MGRILIWSPNYAPELIGIPPLVADAAEWLATRGHRVEVVTAVPNYPERRIRTEYRGAIWRSDTEKAVRVHRSWLRVRPTEGFLDKVLYEASFAALSAPRFLALLPRVDVAVCVVPSLLAAAVAASATRRTRLVLWVQDLVGEAARSVADVPSGTVGVAHRLERYAAARASRVVVCSPGFEEHFTGIGVEPSRLQTVLNWVDTSVIREAEPSQDAHPTRFLYAGNLGYTQGFDTLARAVDVVGSGIEVQVVGAGNADGQVRALGLSLLPPVPRCEFPALLGTADVHIVIQRSIAAGANLPSKIAPYLASGRPIVASIAPETPAAQLLKESGGALIVAAERPDLLADAMVRLRDNPDLRRRLGAAGRAYAVAHLDKEPALRRLEDAFLGGM